MLNANNMRLDYVTYTERKLVEAKFELIVSNSRHNGEDLRIASAEASPMEMQEEQLGLLDLGEKPGDSRWTGPVSFALFTVMAWRMMGEVLIGRLRNVRFAFDSYSLLVTGGDMVIVWLWALLELLNGGV
jgi:hypothetical protein